MYMGILAQNGLFLLLNSLSVSVAPFSFFFHFAHFSFLKMKYIQSFVFKFAIKIFYNINDNSTSHQWWWWWCDESFSNLMNGKIGNSSFDMNMTRKYYFAQQHTTHGREGERDICQSITNLNCRSRFFSFYLSLSPCINGVWSVCSLINGKEMERIVTYVYF